MSTLFVNKLTNLDFSYLDPTLGVVGESWLLDIQLAGDLNDEGMVLDFGLVKKQVRDYVDQYIDHCLLVPKLFQGCAIKDQGDRLFIDFTLESGEVIHHDSISSAVALIEAETIDSDSVRHNILAYLKGQVPDNVHSLDVQLYPEPSLEKYYRYSHGLRKHAGNCQRIAHGHRSDLKVYVDDKPSDVWQEYWLKKWQDIYIGTTAHLKQESDSQYQFEYQAPQGLFRLHLPKNNCYLMACETTVENIAQHLANETAKKVPGKSVRVIAFEGIGKGAIASARLDE